MEWMSLNAWYLEEHLLQLSTCLEFLHFGTIYSKTRNALKESMTLQYPDSEFFWAPLDTSCMEEVLSFNSRRCIEFCSRRISNFHTLFSFPQTTPPFYRIEAITVPVAMWTGGQDWVCRPMEIAQLRFRTTNVVYYKEFPDWTHWDFIWGIDAHQRAYKVILGLMEKYRWSHLELKFHCSHDTCGSARHSSVFCFLSLCWLSLLFIWFVFKFAYPSVLFMNHGVFLSYWRIKSRSYC